MPTTSNFGWTTPADTDLVKDGAAAIRTLGNGIDTSLVDLKGGTTGQVLSKASNTDLDYTWVTTDDANAIQNAIVDAKGDLIAASAADTPARLAVGANDTMLVADSTQTTGLAYKSAATLYPWTTYTPSYSALTIGNGTVVSRYQKIGKLVNVYFKFTLGSTSAVSGGAYFTTPTTPSSTQSPAQLLMRDAGTAWWFGACIVEGTSVYLNNQKVSGNYTISESIGATTPFTWTTNDFLIVNLSYEEA